MRVAMIGTGYVGLVSGACFSEFGTDVICVDKDADKIARLEDGIMPIYEPGLEVLVENNVKAGRLTFTTDLKEGVKDADAVFIAVGTPTRRGDGHADLSYVYAAAEEIAEAMDGFTVIVTKSTVPVGTGREVERIIREKRPDAEFAVVSNPEFLREGSAIGDFMRPDRVVIGTSDERAREVMSDLYRPLYLIETPIVFTTRETSEMIKYAANTFLAAKITFINEIADLCEKVGADVHDVARGIGLDGRIGKKFLHPGPGYGGSCFPKDTKALVQIAGNVEYEFELLKGVIEVNKKQQSILLTKLQDRFGSLDGKKIAVLGLAFKPNTDDMREAASIPMASHLIEQGANVIAYDPVAMEQAKKIINPNVAFAASTEEALKDADATLILTEWSEFKDLNIDTFRTNMKQPIIFDGRNCYDIEVMNNKGIEYYSMGRPAVNTREKAGV